MNVSITVNPIPDLSRSGRDVYNGCLANSILSIPSPLSEIITVTSLPFISLSIDTNPFLLFSYPCIIEFVTASDTAVLTSVISSIVGSNCDIKAATDTLAKLSFSDLLGYE